MDRFETMQIFAEVAKQQSFVLASEALGISAPAVTRAVAALEKHLGVKLFNRTTRHVRLTESGEKYLQDTKQILERLTEAEDALKGVYTKPSGTLTITAPVLFGEKHVMPIITEYLKLHPQVSIQAQFYDRVSNLLEEEIDIAVRIGPLRDSSLYATTVGEVKKVLCASPDYLSKAGTPSTLTELAEHQIVFPTSVESTPIWHFNHKGKKTSVKLNPQLSCNQNGGALRAAVAGYGITRLMSYQVGEELAKGSLQSLLPDYEEAAVPVAIVHVEGRRMNAKIRSFFGLCNYRFARQSFY